MVVQIVGQKMETKSCLLFFMGLALALTWCPSSLSTPLDDYVNNFSCTFTSQLLHYTAYNIKRGETTFFGGNPGEQHLRCPPNTPLVKCTEQCEGCTKLLKLNPTYALGSLALLSVLILAMDTGH